MAKFDVSYITVDSIAEGVGASQIQPLIYKLSQKGLKVHLTSYEKFHPSEELKSKMTSCGAVWSYREFKTEGFLGGLKRIDEITKIIPDASLVHARSDIPAVAAIYAKIAPVLWDVRSLWSDQRAFLEDSFVKRQIIKSTKLYRWLKDLIEKRYNQ